MPQLGTDVANDTAADDFAEVVQANGGSERIGHALKNSGPHRRASRDCP